MTPVEASLKENEMIVLENINNKTRNVPKAKAKFKVGDKVRISRIKAIFEKGYLPNWSEELYVVDKVQKTTPVTYVVKDLLGETIKGSFYTEELQKAVKKSLELRRLLERRK